MKSDYMETLNMKNLTDGTNTGEEQITKLEK